MSLSLSSRNPLEGVIDTDAAASLMDIPTCTLRLKCETTRPFSFPAGATLEPYLVLRGLIGGAITARSRELARALFKLEPLRDLGGRGCSEAPGTPWRLRLSQLYAREVSAGFEILIELFGQDPCDLADELVAAVELAGSGRSYRDWRSGRSRRWGLEVPAPDGNGIETVPFDVVGTEVSLPVALRDRCERAVDRWRQARGALLVFRTLTVLSTQLDGMRKGLPLAVTGEVDAASIIGNSLRRLALIDLATRRNPAERRRADLREVLAAKDRMLAATAAEFPLRCADAVTVPLEYHPRHRRAIRGLLGSARFSGTSCEPWLPGFAACELLGVGESTAYGAGQVAWLPAD